MALVLKDRVQETSITTGTGTITLAGAVSGFQSFSSAIGNTNTTYYTITNGAEWEVGIGTYTSSGNTLSRDTVLESSNGGSLVNFSAGTKNVFVTYPAEKAVTLDNTLPVSSGGTGTATAFTTGSIVFAGASGTYLQNNAGFFWDNTNSRLGIGTAAPATKITINNNTVLPSAGPPSSTSAIWVVGADSVASGINFDSFAIQTNFITRRANGTAASPTALAANNTIFQFAARGYGATGYSTGGRAQFLFAASEDWTDTAQGAHITFLTTTNGTATALERVRIDNAGNVGIGTTSPTQRLTVNGAVGYNAPITVTDATHTVATTTNWIIANRAGTVTLTLPAAASFTGRILTVKNVQAETVISASSDVVPIGSTSAGTAILSATAGKFATIVSDGTNWIVMQAN